MRMSFGGERAVAIAAPLTLLFCLSTLSAAPAQAQEAAAEATQLDPLVVTATRSERPLSSVGSSLTLITAEDLENRETNYVADILREVPGVSVNRSGGPGALTEVRLRGTETNQTLVLIDGIEVNDPAGASFFNFAHLLAADVERIEILRGPQSVLYGSEAVGGVINIITKSGGDRPNGAVSLEGGSFRTGQANASLGAGGERYNAFISGTHMRSNGISQAKSPGGSLKPDGYENSTVFTKLAARPVENLELDFVARYTRYDQDIDDFTTRAVEADLQTKGEQRYGRAQARLDLFDGHWQQRFGATLTRMKARDYNSGNRTNTATGGKTKFDYQSDVLFDTPELANASHLVTLGLEQERESVELNSAFADLDRSFRTRSVFGQYQIDLLERVSLTAGLRHDANQRFEDTQTYRFTAAYNHIETGTRLRASYGTAVKNPTVTELYGFDQSYQGNPDLKPESSRGWDIGIEQDLFRDRLTLGATWFQQNIEDLITGAGRTSVNLDGRSRSRGVELTADLDLSSGFSIQGSYTFNDTRDPNGDRLTKRPRHSGSVNLNYRFLEDRANVNLGVLYNGNQHDLAFDQNFNTSVVSLRSYTLVNLAGSYRITDNLEIFGRVENALNENYEESYTYNTPGRAAYAGLRLHF